MFYEINKKLLQITFNGNLTEIINAGYYIDWTTERIRKAFNFGCGTMDDFNTYKDANRNISIFVEV